MHALQFKFFELAVATGLDKVVSDGDLLVRCACCAVSCYALDMAVVILLIIDLS